MIEANEEKCIDCRFAIPLGPSNEGFIACVFRDVCTEGPYLSGEMKVGNEGIVVNFVLDQKEVELLGRFAEKGEHTNQTAKRVLLSIIKFLSKNDD